MEVAAVVFEGGNVENPLQAQMARLRAAVAADTLEKLARCRQIHRVILASNDPDLAAEARALGAEWWRTPSHASFHFGRELQRLIRDLGLEAVIYLSGAAVPTIAPAELEWVANVLAAQERVVVVNNLMSADLVAFRPAAAALTIELPAADNFLGYLLRREAGLERILIPSSPAIHFDLDTPADYLVLDLSGRAGPRARRALADLDWDRSRLAAARRVLDTDLAEVALIGRVGTPAIDFLNRWLRVRLRVISEERGMKALGRDERGEVVSLVAQVMEDIGPERFLAHLASICHAIFFDTRVVFAHGGRRVSEWDRFHSDLGRPEAIRDPWVRRFTAAALAAGIPCVLGGHSAVSGGLMVLAETVARESGRLPF